MSKEIKAWVAAGVGNDDVAVAMHSGENGDWFLLIGVAGKDGRPNQIRVMMGGLSQEELVKQAGDATAAVATPLGVNIPEIVKGVRSLITDHLATNYELKVLLAKGLSSGTAGHKAIQVFKKPATKRAAPKK